MSSPSGNDEDRQIKTNKFPQLFKSKFSVDLLVPAHSSEKKVLGQLKNREKCFKICYVWNALVYVDIDQGIHKGKMKVALNEKQN